MTWFRRDRCGTHQGSLLEFAARRAGGQEVSRALDHVETCGRCASDLAATTLILHALRRLHDETLLAEPATDGWERLRSRLQASRRRRSSRLLSGLPGVAIAFLLCALVSWPAGPGRAFPVVSDGAAPASSGLGMPRTSIDTLEPDAYPALVVEAAPMLVVIGHGGTFDAHTPGARAQSVRSVDSLVGGSSPVDDPLLNGHPAPLVGFVDATRR